MQEVTSSNLVFSTIKNQGVTTFCNSYFFAAAHTICAYL